MPKEIIQFVEFDSISANRYKSAAKFMVSAAGECFGIQIPPVVATCWENTLELMYYTDHILDHLQSASERQQFGQHAIECMFADPLDWEYLKFGETQLDQTLSSFRTNLLDTTVFDNKIADTTLELFEQTELVKQQITINGLATARSLEGQKCAKVLMELGNNLTEAFGSEKYKEWFNKFWEFGNIADLFIDYKDDVDQNLLQTENNLANRLLLGKIAVKELFELVRLSTPWLIAKYIKAGKYLLDDRQTKPEPKSNKSVVLLKNLYLQSEIE